MELGTCKYIANWRYYTKRDLNLKWSNLGSLDIPKLIIFLHIIRKGWWCYLDCYLETCKTGNDRVTFAGNQHEIAWNYIKTKNAASTDCHVAGLMELGSHIWHLYHLVFDFWASLCLLFHLSVAGEVLF